jgi:hypothetical protein
MNDEKASVNHVIPGNTKTKNKTAANVTDMTVLFFFNIHDLINF